jgi:hypothetical protein
MTCEAKVYVGQVLNLDFTIRNQAGAVVDISGATLSMSLRCLGRSKTTKTPTLTTDGTDGRCYYNTVVDTDLDRQGKWIAQAYVTLAGIEYPSSPIEFMVYNRN